MRNQHVATPQTFCGIENTNNYGATVNLYSAKAAEYRGDIDGLRAIAVLSVIIFHINKAILPGGFVGVDIFFVISGFLITRNIVLEMQRGAFSIVEFYRRRIKRIAPAMLVVVAVTLVFAQLLMLPEDARDTGKAAIWSLSSMANVYFWLYQDSGYFATDSANLPMLHLWSLGVEEQFYVLWPVILLICFRTRHHLAFMLAMLGVAIGSFILGSILFPTAPSFAYYMLPTRAGELLLGALAGVVMVKGLDEKLSPKLLGMMALIGGLLVAVSLVFLSESLPFPGLLAVLPTAGVTFLILAGRRRSDHFLRRFLTLKPLVWIGLISYSAYLWHWPLLSFYHYGYGEIGPITGIVILLLTLILGWGSYRYIEQPARRTNVGALRVFLGQLVLPGTVIGILALLIVYPARFGFPLPSSSYLARLSAIREETRPAFQFEWVCQRQRLGSKDILNKHCILGDPQAGAPRAILWGDSNAAHFIGMIDVYAKGSNFRFRNVEIGSCPPLNIDPKAFVDAKREVDCRESLKIAWPLVHEYPVVIISASWSSYQKKSANFLPAFFDMVRRLAAGGRLVILIGKVPEIAGYDRRCREKALKYPFLDCPNLALPIAPDVAEANAQLRAFARRYSNVYYFETTSYLCPDGKCRPYADDGNPKYFDASHLTMTESTKLGTEIVNREGVPLPFRLISTWKPKSEQQEINDALIKTPEYEH
jgi:peptidoglycan/LPS O-acetylase OafA/YrhL